MKIRKANPEDAAEIANVHINSWREAYKGLLPQSFLDDRPLYFKNRYELWKRVTADELQTAYEKGFKKGYLWVLKDNPTIRFYESTGARLTNDIKTAVIGGQDVEELCYIWDDIKLAPK